VNESVTRSLLKSITYRIAGSLSTFIIALSLTGELELAIGISLFELVSKIVLYWAHERIWNNISYGKK